MRHLLVNFWIIFFLFIVWQVKWAKDNLDGYLNFYSVSGDGRVSNWTIVKTALWTNDTLLINFCKTLSNLGEESVTDLLMGMVQTVIVINNHKILYQIVAGQFLSSQMMTAPSLSGLMKVNLRIFIEDQCSMIGMVYLCTTQYSSRYLNTYQAHNTPVYNIQWNTFIPNIFITCASEWIIKIWDKDCKWVDRSFIEIWSSCDLVV